MVALPLQGQERAAEPPIRLGLYVHGLLFDGHGGIDSDLVAELVRRSGWRFEVQVMARARIWADLEAGELDMTVSGIWTPERERFAWFLPYLSMKNLALVPKGLDLRTPEAFLRRRELQVGVVRGFRHGDAVDRLLEACRREGRVQESPDTLALFHKLRDRRVDLIFAQPPVFLRYLKELGMEGQVEILDWAPREKGVPHGLTLSRRRFSAEEVSDWRKLLEGMRRDGALRRIYRRHLPSEHADRLLEGL